MYQSGRVGDEAKKRKSPAKSGRVGITAYNYKSLNLPKEIFVPLNENGVNFCYSTSECSKLIRMVSSFKKR